jgi:hypothetical protein
LTKSAEIDLEKLRRLRDDFEFFARHCLSIRTKGGKLEPLILNRAQRFLHDRLEKQRKETGRVRAIVLKGRQMGASTYIEARFYWRLWGGKGLRAFILTHEQAATDNLFSMAKRYHENVPEPLRHPTQAANAKELAFAGRECSYSVATAGTKEVGRSATMQLFHGSEVAFWPNAEDHIAGLEQALADVDGTERILESTANGIGNSFQRRYSAAQRGSSDIPVFMPWFWSEDYQAEPPNGWVPPKQWEDYSERNGLTWQQLYWAFIKNRDMASATGQSENEPCWKFKQEYPANAEEAFQTAGNSFIPSDKVAAARVPPADILPIGPLIIGVDPARGGGDKTGIVDRQGRRVGRLVSEILDFDDTMMVAGRVAQLIRLHRPAAVNIDVGGLGAGVFDRLRELGFHQVNAVNFGSSPLGLGPTGDELYENRRAEMWDVMRDWFNDPAGVQIPNNDALHGDLTAPVWGPGQTRHKSNNELVIEPKDKIRERLGFSPDMGDALALTFAVPVQEESWYDDEPEHDRAAASTGY